MFRYIIQVHDLTIKPKLQFPLKKSPISTYKDIVKYIV